MFLRRFKKPILLASIFTATIPLSYIYFNKQPKLITTVKQYFSPKSPEELERLCKEGVNCFRKLEIEKSLKLLKKAAEYGHGPSAGYLSYMYLNGDQVEKDLKQAFKYSKIAAEKDDVHGLNNLGLMYFNGLYVKQDTEKAIKCFNRAADLGFSVAQHNLGVMYIEGKNGGIIIHFYIYINK